MHWVIPPTLSSSSNPPSLQLFFLSLSLWPSVCVSLSLSLLFGPFHHLFLTLHLSLSLSLSLPPSLSLFISVFAFRSPPPPPPYFFSCLSLSLSLSLSLPIFPSLLSGVHQLLFHSFFFIILVSTSMSASCLTSKLPNIFLHQYWILQ